MAESLSSFNPMARTRISSECLPNDVLNHILKYLPLRDLVRTSILSKEWRYKWLTVPYLDFDMYSQFLGEGYTPASIINRVLAQHIGPIINFTFILHDSVFNGSGIEDDSTIQIWLKLLSNHPIKNFTLFLKPWDLMEVPKHLFSFDCLKNLSLGSVIIKLPPLFKGFSCLLTLCLDYVGIDSKDFNMLVSKCPALKELHMSSYCYGAINIVIDAPNLKSFSFDGTYNSIFFENAKIEIISIFSGTVEGEYDALPPVNESDMIKFFGQLPSVRKLKFDGTFLMFLAEGVVPYKLPNYLNYLTTLELFNVDLEMMDNVSCLLCLIRSSPNVHTLKIGGLGNLHTIHNSMEAPAIEYLKAQEKCEVSLGHNIKSITMHNFRGSKAEMAFVKVILLKSMLLRKLRIRNFGKSYEVVKALAGFRRASSEAVIEFI